MRKWDSINPRRPYSSPNAICGARYKSRPPRMNLHVALPPRPIRLAEPQGLSTVNLPLSFQLGIYVVTQFKSFLDLLELKAF